MNEQKSLKILAFVCLAGAGKTTAVDYVSSKGVPRVYFGGVILDAMKKQGIEWTEQNEKAFREEIRRVEGNDFVVRQIIDQIRGLEGAGQKRIVADGIYSWTEYKAMKREFPGELTVVAVVAPKNLRHHRLSNRAVRPLTIEQAGQRDWAEIENLEKGGPIAIADYFIHNDSTKEALHAQIDTILETIGFLR
ncbi:MAG: AAA family ATPase [Candidatus Saccharimonas sp.]